MKLRTRKAFTLVELIIASLLFGFMIMSLATIYSTATKHMFQSYRQNTVKSNASVAMKTITAKLAAANRIDLPGPGSWGNSLRFAVNVDQTTGCYPINPAEPVTWHEICYAPDVTGTCPLGNCLYYHTGTIAGGGNCPNAPFWGAFYQSSVGCGTAGLGTVTLLASFVQPPAGGAMFSRALGNGTLGNNVVNISLRVLWDPAVVSTAGRDFRASSKKIDSTLTTSVGIVRAGQ